MHPPHLQTLLAASRPWEASTSARSRRISSTDKLAADCAAIARSRDEFVEGTSVPVTGVGCEIVPRKARTAIIPKGRDIEFLNIKGLPESNLLGKYLGDLEILEKKMNLIITVLQQ